MRSVINFFSMRTFLIKMTVQLTKINKLWNMNVGFILFSLNKFPCLKKIFVQKFLIIIYKFIEIHYTYIRVYLPLLTTIEWFTKLVYKQGFVHSHLSFPTLVKHKYMYFYRMNSHSLIHYVFLVRSFLKINILRNPFS